MIAYAKRCGGPMMVRWCFQNGAKIADVVARSWRLENVEDSVRLKGQTRMGVLEATLSTPCRCKGKWKPAALALFAKNELDVVKWCKAVCHSMEKGREKGLTLPRFGHVLNRAYSHDEILSISNIKSRSVVFLLCCICFCFGNRLLVFYVLCIMRWEHAQAKDSVKERCRCRARWCRRG